jgi:hypothetical protein
MSLVQHLPPNVCVCVRVYVVCVRVGACAASACGMLCLHVVCVRVYACVVLGLLPAGARVCDVVCCVCYRRVRECVMWCVGVVNVGCASV